MSGCYGRSELSGGETFWAFDEAAFLFVKVMQQNEDEMKECGKAWKRWYRCVRVLESAQGNGETQSDEEMNQTAQISLVESDLLMNFEELLNLK